ncbi:SUN domain-containing protein 3-like isoform X1 [Gasterosteus aculeatus]
MMESFMPTKAQKNRSFVLSGPIAQDTPISTDSSLHHKERTTMQRITDALFGKKAHCSAEAPPAAPGVLGRILRYLFPWGRPATTTPELRQESTHRDDTEDADTDQEVACVQSPPPRPKPAPKTPKRREMKVNVKIRGNWKTTLMYFLLMLLFAGAVTQYAHLSIQLCDARQQITALSQLVSRLNPVADNMANFAQESQGARVLTRLSSYTFRTTRKETMVDELLSWFTTSTDHQRLIQDRAGPSPGERWCFAGAEGHAVVSLSHPVKITHVTLGHITKQPSLTGEIHSVPKEFSVYGMANEDEEGIRLGTFTYDQDAPASQTFELPSLVEDVFSHVKLQIRSNWGDEEQTCLYNFRVHGIHM